MSSDHAEPDALVLEQLGTQLEARRRQLAKSAREVALGAGISPVYLRVIETGRNPKTGRASRPSAEVLVRLARELDLEADDLLGRAGYRDLRAEHAAPEAAEPAAANVLSGLASNVQAIAAAVELARTRPSDFMRLLVADELSQFEAHLSAVAAGSLLCGPADEPRVRRLALLEGCRRSLQAVSHEDDEWWLGARAADYLELHEQIAARSPSVAMERIFLLAPERRDAYDEVFARQAAAGVEVLVADPRDVPDSCRRDLEIYDRSLLREATSSASAGGGRFAEFTDDHARLQRAEAAFVAARRVARTVS